MKVRIIIGNNAYACITTPQRSMDVLLSPGISAVKSLRATAADMRDEAETKYKRATVILEAAEYLARMEKVAA